MFGADLFGHEEADRDDDLKAEFLCPFCAEEFDVVGLCCHIDEEHPVQAMNGVYNNLLVLQNLFASCFFVYVFLNLSYEKSRNFASLLSLRV